VSEETLAGPEESGSLRLFLAIELPAGVRAAVAQTMRNMQTGCQFVGARPAWVKPESVHLPLVFLGWQMAARRLDAQQAALRGARGFAPFDLSLSGVSLFPTPRNPRVVAMGLHGDLETAAALQRRLSVECRATGFEVESRDFRPHVTLARIKALKGLSSLREIVDGHRNRSAGRITVDSVVLYRSHLLPDGAEYEELARVPLAG
jgi:2'-5' RNA ligase